MNIIYLRSLLSEKLEAKTSLDNETVGFEHEE